MHWDWQLYFQKRQQSNQTPFDRHFIQLMPCGEHILSYGMYTFKMTKSKNRNERKD